MREILFRGKRIDNGEWVYGNFVESRLYDGNSCISILDYKYQVIPKTVGQYTGLTDKNGIMIFEGDIVRFLNMTGEVVCECGSYQIAFTKTIDWEKVESEIKPYTGCDNIAYFCFNDNVISLWEIYWNFNEEDDYIGIVEVIGNIHDNPELIGDVENEI